jgi:exopolysaccharide biosynthesis predicted pyruvyltransferase EpsI
MITRYNKNKIVIFPQSVYYNDISLADSDKIILEQHDVHLTLRQQESLEFCQKHFPNVSLYGIPDVAFMIGDVESKASSPTYDVLILRRLQFENGKTRQYSLSYWDEALEFFRNENKTFLLTSWLDHKYEKQEFDLATQGFEILDLSIEVLSLGKLVITDTLHGSVLSVLMNKPHVYIDNGYNKVIGTRSFAFKDKEECDYKYLRAQRAENPLDAAKRAVKMLKNNLFVDENI